MDEKTLATRLLKMKKEGYPPLHRIVIGNGKIQILRLLILVFAVTIIIQSWNEPESKIMLGLAGLIIGAQLKEIVVYIKIGKGWSFTKKVTNWDLVEKIANDTQ